MKINKKEAGICPFFERYVYNTDHEERKFYCSEIRKKIPGQVAGSRFT